MELRISEEADWDLFEVIAQKLEQGLQGVWTQRADGFDERYWDFLVDGHTLTLHLQHYLGIYLFNTQRGQSTDLLVRAYDLLAPDFAVEIKLPG